MVSGSRPEPVPNQYKCSECGAYGHNARSHTSRAFRQSEREKKKMERVGPVAGIRGEEAAVRVLCQDPKNRWKGPGGFRAFAKDYWTWLRHTPDHLTTMQEGMADFLQNGPERIVILAPRGVGKSILLAAYVTWTLFQDADEKIVVISKSSKFAGKWTSHVLRTIKTVTDLQHMKPTRDQSSKGSAFDVSGGTVRMHNSVSAFGIEEQIEGSRGSLIIPDDIETKKNSRTSESRALLMDQIADFRNLRILGRPYRIAFIGTLQNSDSCYYKLADMGFQVMKWPICYPSYSFLSIVGEHMAPKLLQDLQRRPELMTGGVDERIGKSTDPERFPAQEIKERIESGWNNFMLQSMLTPLFGEHRCPLKYRNLIVSEDTFDPESVPVKLEHTISEEYKLLDMPMKSFGPIGPDHFYRASNISEEKDRMTQVVMALDPSSTEGEDDFAYVIMGFLNGYYWLLKCGTLASTSEKDLEGLAQLCVDFRVRTIYDEINYAGGMFRGLFQPILTKVCESGRFPWRCGFDPKGYKRFGNSKESIIVEMLDELTIKNRLVVLRSVIEQDAIYCRKGLSPKRSEVYRLFHQYIRVIPDVSGCLAHDDRLDALAMAVHFFRGQASYDADVAMEERKQKERQLEEDRVFGKADHINGYLVGSATSVKKGWNEWKNKGGGAWVNWRNRG